MKSLKKRNNIAMNNVEAFSCYCYCSCSCGCGTDLVAGLQAYNSVLNKEHLSTYAQSAARGY